MKPLEKNLLIAVAIIVVLVAAIVLLQPQQDSRKEVVYAPTAVATSTPVPAAQEFFVYIRKYAFEPENLTVPAGSKVTWVNEDDETHSIDFGDDGSGELVPNQEYSQVFDLPTYYEYSCGVHGYTSETAYLNVVPA